MKVLLVATVQSHICQFHRPLVAMLHEHGCEVHVAARNNLAEKNGLKLDFVEQVFDCLLYTSMGSSAGAAGSSGISGMRASSCLLYTSRCV